MGQVIFKVRISAKEAFEIVRGKEDAQLVYEEEHTLEDGKYIGTLVFEKYYMRNSNRAALTVIIDNFKGVTAVRAIATGSSQGWLLNIDWGASEEFAHGVKRILESYVLED